MSETTIQPLYPATSELDEVQIAFGVATTQTEIDPERRWQAIKLVSEFLGRLRIASLAQGSLDPARIEACRALIHEICGDELNGGLIRDICFTVWSICHNPTHADGNADWGSDTLPTVQKAVALVREKLIWGSQMSSTNEPAQRRPSRDELARIIDLGAFKGWDGLHESALKDMDAEAAVRCADTFYKKQKDGAFAKADAIIALIGNAEAGPSVASTDRQPVEPASDYEDEAFNRGVTHTVELLAKTIGAEGWVAGDGSEDYDEDLAQTLLNILEAKGLYDSDDAQFLSASPAFPKEIEPTELEDLISDKSAQRAADAICKEFFVVRRSAVSRPDRSSGGA